MAHFNPDGTAADPVLWMALFGPVALAIGNRKIRFKSLKLRALLGYIALSEQQLETRERLVGLLWSESGEAQARAVLRQVIRELRSVLTAANHAGLFISPREIGFERGTIAVDVLHTLEAVEAGALPAELLEREHLPDELMAGLEDLDPVFRTWLLAKRQTVRDRLMRALEQALADDGHDDAERCGIAQAILNLDPTHEDACRRLMRARAINGDTAGALRVYNALWNLLDDEYGMEPAEATQALVADIKRGAYDKTGVYDRPPAGRERAGPERSAARPMTPPARPMAPAALPMAIVTPTIRAERPANDSPDPSPAAGSMTSLWLSVQQVAIREVDRGKAHLVVEFRQHLIASLVRFREWQVTDSLAAGEAAAGVAGHYDVQLIAYQAGQAVNMMITLKELKSGIYIWTETFELNLENWFVYQRRVVQRIAMGLNVHLSAERLRRFSDRPDVSLGIYDRWLRAQTRVRTFSPVHWESLTRQFADIIEEAPEFAPAYCGLADLYNIKHTSHPGFFRSADNQRTSLAYARRAAQLDPVDMRAHRCLAWSHIMAKQFDQAAIHMQVAFELNPNDSWTVISVALLTAFSGEPQRASELARMAMDLTLAPSRTHWVYQTDILYLSGDYEAAVMAADQSQDVLFAVPAWRAAALAQLGRFEEAAADAARFTAKVRANWFGTGPPTDEAIMKWMLHIYPIRRREEWEHLRNGLRLAGLPTDVAEFDSW